MIDEGKNACDYSVNPNVSQDKKKPLALFFHGFATSPTDLCMLEDAFSQAGFQVQSPWLAGHPLKDCAPNKECVLNMEDLRQNILDIINNIDHEKYDVYLVGFSLGGALAIDVAADIPLAGVLAINPFFEPVYPRAALFLLNLVTKLPWLPRKRRFQTSLKESRKYLIHEVPRLPIKSTREIIDKSSTLGERLSLSKCPVIIVHSLDDRVAAFSASARLVKRAARSDIRLVPIHDLNHYMQFDIAPHVLRDLALAHFQQNDVDEVMDPKVLEAVYNQHQTESRHWSGIIFQIIGGFFALFGALLAFTLPDVLSAYWGETVGKVSSIALPLELQIKHQKALAGTPYYLVSYAFIIYLYLILLSLYFFYLNRIDTFIRIHIEPLQQVAHWVQSRTRVEATGKTSRLMTNAVSIPIVLIPLLSATILMISIPIVSPDRVFVWESRNIFLHTFYFSTIIMAIFAAWSLISLQNHASSQVYGIPAPITTTLSVEKQISRLYSSVCKGAYARPHKRNALEHK